MREYLVRKRPLQNVLEHLTPICLLLTTDGGGSSVPTSELAERYAAVRTTCIQLIRVLYASQLLHKSVCVSLPETLESTSDRQRLLRTQQTLAALNV